MDYRNFEGLHGFTFEETATDLSEQYQEGLYYTPGGGIVKIITFSSELIRFLDKMKGDARAKFVNGLIIETRKVQAQNNFFVLQLNSLFGNRLLDRILVSTSPVSKDALEDGEPIDHLLHISVC
ncbi:TPA: hypothetical protein DCG61_00060 [Patescibacteria group bacterium]|jgi:hypothetical protein|nr:hypothetical protein [Patescibacteria group bacterium]